MLTEGFPFIWVLVALIGVAIVGFGWWRIEGDAVATRATALYSAAFVGLFVALISGFVFVRSLAADLTDAAPGHEAMMSGMAGMMSGGIDGHGPGTGPGMPGGMMPGGGMVPGGGMPSGHPPVDGWEPGPASPTPSQQVTALSTRVASPPSPSPSPGGGMMPGMPGGMMPGDGMMPGVGQGLGSAAMHEQLAAHEERMQRRDATTALLFLIGGLLTWWFALGAARELRERPERETYRGLVKVGAIVGVLYGAVVAVGGLLHALAPGLYVDRFLEDLQRRGGIVEVLSGGLLAAASVLLLWSVRGRAASPETDPSE